MQIFASTGVLQCLCELHHQQLKQEFVDGRGVLVDRRAAVLGRPGLADPPAVLAWRAPQKSKMKAEKGPAVLGAAGLRLQQLVRARARPDDGH